MKNKFLFTLIVSIALLSCRGLTDEKEPDVSLNKCTQYACPIHQDKTSTTLEKCPACNKMMIPTDSLKKDSLKRMK